MCGILGGNNQRWNYESALNSMYHRGPDGQNLLRKRNIIMGFVRLSIIDLSCEAMQPMISNDGKFIITFNGEIYDYKKVRSELERKGYIFNTFSDTEVLLNSFIEWKEKMIEHIEGIFAVAIYDVEADNVYLFRDHVGVKPLYYYIDGYNFAYASELKGIERLIGRKLEIDTTAIYDFFNYLYIPEPKTIYKKIKKLEPASYMIYSLSNNKIVKKEKYWNVNINMMEGNIPSRNDLDEKALKLRELVDKSIKRQLVADVPVGTFFSGGVDSSIVTFVANQYKKEIFSYAISFTDKLYDESSYIKKIGKKINAKCQIKYFEQEEFQKLKRELRSAFDEPFGDISFYPTYFVSNFARKKVKVVLTGDGGDELFGGYNRYFKKYPRRKRNTPIILANIFKIIQSYITVNKSDYFYELQDEIYNLIPEYLYQEKIDFKKLRRIFKIPLDYDDAWYYRKFYFKELPIVTRLRYMDFMTYLPSDILAKVDRMSMLASLEARVPLLDKDVIEFAFSLTQNECNPDGKSKGLFRYAYEKDIPKELFERPKAGFMMPHRYMNSYGNILEHIYKEYEKKTCIYI